MKPKQTISILLTLFAFLLFPLNAKAEAVSKITVKEMIVKHSLEMGIDPALALSIAKAESGYMHNRRSKYGAVGVFQLMPSTAKKLGYNPYSVKENIKGGIAYYKMMYKMFGSVELALAAYNAGPGNVKKYKGIPPFTETRRFVSSIMHNYNSLKINPDPAMSSYKNLLKEVSYIEDIGELAEEEDADAIQDEILQSYLENQGI